MHGSMRRALETEQSRQPKTAALGKPRDLSPDLPTTATAPAPDPTRTRDHRAPGPLRLAGRLPGDRQSRASPPRGAAVDHRQHARVEDRIRQAKAMGLRNLPCKAVAENHAWLQCVLAAIDLVAWSKLVCFYDQPDLAYCEIANFRYRIMHTAARIVQSGRCTYMRLDHT